MKKSKSPSYTSDDVMKAMREAVKKALEECRKSGVSTSIWKDGKVVIIPANQIWRLLRKF